MKTILSLAVVTAFIGTAAMAQTSEAPKAPVTPPTIGELHPAPVPQPAESQKIEVQPQEKEKIAPTPGALK